MSHQTGIKANDELKKQFNKCKDGKVRALKIVIEDEQLKMSQSKSIGSTWEKDFDKIIPTLIVENDPCYIIYRLDTKTSSGYDWLFISWSPDNATTRQKMLYASTKATLKQDFGTAQIKEEFHATSMDEMNLAGYNRHKRAVDAPAPLTHREEELKQLRKSELSSATDYNIDSRQSTLGHVNFPITDDAKQAIVDMKSSKLDYVQLKLDCDNEKVHVSKTEANMDVNTLPSMIPEKSARYHLYRFKHHYESDYFESIVFIYSMPGYSCSIKERMLYSSCKATVLGVIEDLGIEVTKKLEIESGADINKESLLDEIHPKKLLHRPAFAKPKGPPNRGAKRLTKVAGDS